MGSYVLLRSDGMKFVRADESSAFTSKGFLPTAQQKCESSPMPGSVQSSVYADKQYTFHDAFQLKTVASYQIDDYTYVRENVMMVRTCGFQSVRLVLMDKLEKHLSTKNPKKKQIARAADVLGQLIRFVSVSQDDDPLTREVRALMLLVATLLTRRTGRTCSIPSTPPWVFRER